MCTCTLYNTQSYQYIVDLPITSYYDQQGLVNHGCAACTQVAALTVWGIAALGGLPHPK